MQSPVAEVHPEYWKHMTETVNSLLVEMNGFVNGQAGVEPSFKALLNALITKLNYKKTNG